ncbi:Crp/Fnr family transcriptional regulator [Sandarakinorhabdus sp.]|uniref:Crp/Fnr family transcriptional regulator n=1 Tax=Sandarakinorhabdus sp. TaxID=1916663 RepID=UPI00286E5E63|nr:Crp/Fnr family transcriptional regulator [Sandarakinorhabdus sp.]
MSAPDTLTAVLGRLLPGGDVAARIAARGADRRYTAGDVILPQGETTDKSWLVLAGRARAQHLTAEGRVVPLHDFLPSDLFGAVAAGTGAQPAEVAALDPTHSLVFRGADFLALMEQHAALGMLVTQSLIRRLNGLVDQMIARTTLSATGRIHAELLRRARAQGGHVISPAPVLSQMAADLDTTRETVSRAISALERRGIITRDAAALTIAAPGRLEAMVI